MFFNKYKKIKYLATASLVVASALFSCEEVIIQEPESAILSDSFFNTNEALESGLVNAYAFLRRTYRNRYFQWGDLRSDSFQPSGGNVDRESIHNSIMDPANDGLLRWRDPYEAIDAVNRIIVTADVTVGDDDRVIVSAPDIRGGIDNNILGQAYAIRARLYFDLIRVWGDVPLFTAPVSAVTEVFRNVTPADQIMRDVVIPDMLLANRLITVNNSEFRFSKSSILALIGDVYLWEGENALARTALLELEALGTHSLVTTPQAWEDLFSNQLPVPRFPEGRGKQQEGAELIFSIPFDDPLNEISSSILSLYAGGAKITVFSNEVEEKWLERFPIDSTWEDLYPDTPPVFTTVVEDEDGNEEVVPLYGDWRLFASREDGNFEDGIGVALGDARIEKWQEERLGLSNNQDDTDIVVYRYADIVLMLAEAELKLGNTGAALERINEIRTARQLPLVTAEDFGSNDADRLDYLLDERQFELFAEGKRWWDLVRNDKVLETLNPILEDRLGADAVPITQDRILWPILNEHIIDNPNLSQNTGW